MPKPGTPRKIIVADSEEELEALTAQVPGEPEEPESPNDEPEKSEDEHLGVVAIAPLQGEILPDGILPSGPVRYQSRITIVDAWQYPGSLRNAPAWIDRNWAGYGDYDPLRSIEAGPCLRVPDPRGGIVLVRIGDYVAMQEVLLTESLSDTRIEAWEQQHFEKLFLPSKVQ